jgi:isochorismate synthase EntC
MNVKPGTTTGALETKALAGTRRRSCTQMQQPQPQQRLLHLARNGQTRCYAARTVSRKFSTSVLRLPLSFDSDRADAST